MAGTSQVLKPPEFLVYARAFFIGLCGAEIFRIAFYAGEGIASRLSAAGGWAQTGLVVMALCICLAYAWKREALAASVRLGKSLRVDLLAAALIGVWSNGLIEPWLDSAHKLAKQFGPQLAPAILTMLLVILFSPLARVCWPRSKKLRPELYFLSDEEIKDKDQDLLKSELQAKSFAETVLASGAHSGLVFGIDGPWGIGKTSFINLAERHWEKEGGEVIVFRFEPLRYASEPDLSERFIRDLSATIQRQVFAPEFRPAASRYSRMLKGKADFSFLGFKISLEPSGETIDDLLEDVDEVLKRIERRVIVVVDDLDRLEAKTVNNVLFTIRRTFKLTQATYILCYDTENLARGKDDGEKAREFLEKFVTVKLSLFVDASTIQGFLERGWKREEQRLLSVPSDSMVKLASVLSELAGILRSSEAAKYMLLVGDLRKVKRFVNAVLLMQIERTDLSKTDFDRRDLVNLMLLHLNYPGLFRQIYVEETEGRSGVFSIKRKAGTKDLQNSKEFAEILQKEKGLGGFLLERLFCVKVLGFDDAQDIEEKVLRSRACFNDRLHRNLEKYLQLIVRFVTPEPRESFKLYQDAVERVSRGEKISKVLEEDEFSLAHGEHAHDQFWRLLVNQSHDFTSRVLGDAVNVLVEYLPRYSSVVSFDRGLRSRSIYSILLLLDRGRWATVKGRPSSDSLESRLGIAHWIWGEGEYASRGLLSSLVEGRGVLGWNDLMVFRLQCSADRQGQLFNVQSALLLYEDINAPTAGLLSDLALQGMRQITQRVFTLFREKFIDQKRNFLAEVDGTPDADFLGDAAAFLKSESASAEAANQMTLADRLAAARSAVKTFVIYQLANREPPTGSGVGCGLYDENGTGDAGGIAKLMNEYVFGVCFDPQHEDNILRFADYCLSHLSSAFFTGDEDGYVPTKSGLSNGLNPLAMGRYWRTHRETFLKRNLPAIERRVVTSGYIATYREDLGKVFAVLDELAAEVLEPAVDVKQEEG